MEDYICALSRTESIKVNGGKITKKYTIYTVNKYDNLSLLAERYNTTVEMLAELNNIADRKTIYVGQKLVVPSVI